MQSPTDMKIPSEVVKFFFAPRRSLSVALRSTTRQTVFAEPLRQAHELQQRLKHMLSQAQGIAKLRAQIAAAVEAKDFLQVPQRQIEISARL